MHTYPPLPFREEAHHPLLRGLLACARREEGGVVSYRGGTRPRMHGKPPLEDCPCSQPATVRAAASSEGIRVCVHRTTSRFTPSRRRTLRYVTLALPSVASHPLTPSPTAVRDWSLVSRVIYLGGCCTSPAAQLCCCLVSPARQPPADSFCSPNPMKNRPSRLWRRRPRARGRSAAGESRNPASRAHFNTQTWPTTYYAHPLLSGRSAFSHRRHRDGETL